MNTSIAFQHLRDHLADDGDIFKASELKRIIDLAVYDYSEYAPYYEEYSLSATQGTLNYTLPDDTLNVMEVAVAADLTVTSFVPFNQTIRFVDDPGTLNYRVILQRVHQKVGEDYPTIPTRHMPYIIDFALVRALHRIADDIARRPATREGQTSEDFRDNANTIKQRADELYRRTINVLFNSNIFVG